MRKFVWLAVIALFAAVLVGPALAGEQSLDPETRERLESLNAAVDLLKDPRPDVTPHQRAWRGESINQAFVTLTGEAINPLFGVTVVGVYNYFRTPIHLRASLPVYDQPLVWVPLLIILMLMLFNSTICEAFPFLKIPLNALGDLVNKAGAVAILPLVVKMFADSVAAPAGSHIEALANAAFPVAHAGQAAGMDAVWHSAGWLLGAVAGFAVYAAVWLTFNVVDVMILICPFPGVDALLKSLRLSIMGLLVGASHVSPTLATVLAAAIAVVCFFTAGWSFRLSVFGSVYSTDILFFRRRDVAGGGVVAFAGPAAQQKSGVPMRTLGTLRKEGKNGLSFHYRPWLILPEKRIDLGTPEGFAAGRGLFNPFLVGINDPSTPWLRLPPRYRGQEHAMVDRFALAGTVDCGMSGALRTWFAENFRGGPAGNPEGAQPGHGAILPEK